MHFDGDDTLGDIRYRLRLSWLTCGGSNECRPRRVGRRAQLTKDTRSSETAVV